MINDETLAYRIKELEHDQDDAKEIYKEIFQRLNDLEKRMAQVLVIAVVASLLVPVVTEVMLKGGS